jgi:photosystem II stability/assembly factor-like uncharacterized protein
MPATVTVTPAAKAEVAAPTKFSSSASTMAGLQHKWDFGDGSTSDEAAPSHTYAKAGDYEVVLRVSNSAGESREVRSPLSVRAMANVAGLSCSGQTNAGWCWQQPRPTGNRVRSVVFVTSKIGWRVGDVGEIFKTTDGGRTWAQQPSGTKAELVEARFASDQRGAVLGVGGVLLTTRDGGGSWAVGKLPVVNFTPSSLRLLPNDVLYVSDVAAYLSTDGGANWTTVSNATAQSETGVFWYVNNATRQVSRSNDWGRTLTPVYDFNGEAAVPSAIPLKAQLVARGDKTAVLRTVVARDLTYSRYKNVFHRTVDGGASWTRVESDYNESEASELVALSADGLHMLSLYLRSRPTISADGGQTWTDVRLPSGRSAQWARLGLDETVVAVTDDEYWLTENLGSSWVRMNPPQPGYISSLERVGSDLLIAVNDDGGRFASADKGQTWTQLVPPQLTAPATYGFGAAFLDAKTGFILDPAGKLLATADGGQTWTIRRDDLTAGGGSVHAVDARTVLVLDAAGRLLRSSDRGLNWVTDPSSMRYSGVRFTHGPLGWGYDGYFNTGNLFTTTDGGLTWSPLVRPPVIGLKDIYQSDANAWVALGTKLVRGPDGYDQFAPDIAYTRDGGKTWQAASGVGEGQLREELLSLAASDEKTIWAVGVAGTMARSDDGGAHWQLAGPGPGPTLRSVAFVDAERGWAVGDYGVIRVTTDGGKTWTVQDSGSRANLARIHIADGKTLWVSSYTGDLLATATGGTR